MNFLLNCAAQVLVILSVALLTLPFLRKESAALRHSVLSVAVVFSLLTPAFNSVIPGFEWSTRVSQHPSIVPIREQIAAFTSSAPPPDRSHDANARDAEAIVPIDASSTAGAFSRQSFMVWISGVGFGLFVLLTGLVRLARVASASTTMRSERWRRLTASISSEYGLNRIVHLLESRNPSVLVTWGAVSPKIILPARSAEWPEDRAGIVLRHELAHVRRRDWILHMFAQTLRIVFWFNPLVWIVCRRLRLESECACDDLVLTNIQGHEYAAHLLDLARVLNRPGQFGLQRYRWHAHPP